MNRTLIAAVAALAVGGATITACGNDDQTAQAVCVDRVTEVRVDDWQCSNDNNDPNFMLWYLAAGQSMFGYGQRAPYGSAFVPNGYRAPVYSAPPRPATAPSSTVTTAKPPTSTSTPTTSAKPSTSSSKPTTQSSKPSTQSKPSTAAPKPQTKAPAAPKPKPAPKPK